MIDSAEPLSCVLWAVAFFAAGLYPLGFMLGAPCSPCCGGSNCDEVFDFNRCIRFVNNVQTSPAIADQATPPTHGVSIAVTRPDDIGAMRVARNIVAPFNMSIRSTASAMMDGQTNTAVRVFSYRTPTGGQEAVRWTITLQGVTIPLSPPLLVQDALFNSATAPRQSFFYSAGLKAVSSAAPVSVAVHSCTVVSGGEWLDGNTVTESSLKAMLTVQLVAGSIFHDVRGIFTINAEIFKYLPRTTIIVLEYVTEHQRGSTKRYGKLRVTVYGDPDLEPQPLPPEGLSPLVIETTLYVNSLLARTPPVFAGETPLTKTATIYSDNVVMEEFSGITLVQNTANANLVFPDVAIFPNDYQLQQQSLGMTVTNVGATPNNLIFSNGIVYAGNVQLSGYRWILAPTLTASRVRTRSMTLNYDSIGINRTDNNWIYDHDLVESFLNGDAQIPYNTSFTMRVSEQSQYCEQPLCSTIAIEFFSGDLNSPKPTTLIPLGYVERVVMSEMTWPVLLIDQEEFTLRIDGICRYYGELSICTEIFEGSGLTVGSTLNSSVEIRRFYCGDLLWVVENGPCRQTYSRNNANGSTETFTLGGDYTLAGHKAGAGCIDGGPLIPRTLRTLIPFESTMPKEGGQFAYGFSEFPSLQSQAVVPPTNKKYKSVITHDPFTGIGYITQDGYEGTECPFRVQWLAHGLSGQVGMAATTIKFKVGTCPILGQVDQQDEAECSWSATSSADWLLAERVAEGSEEGLLKLSINADVQAVFPFGPANLPLSPLRFRSSNVVISSGEITQTWTVEHYQT